MPGAAQTRGMRWSLNDRAYNRHTRQGTAERHSKKDQALMHWDCNNPLTKEEYGGTCLSDKKVYSREWYKEHFGGVRELLNNDLGLSSEVPT